MAKSVLLYALISSICLISCERAIEFTPNDQPQKLVVEATIESGEHPIVYLSKSQDFFSVISLQKLAGSFVRGAIVTISNGERSFKLKEQELSLGEGYSIIYYSVDSSNLAAAFKGEFGRSYTLTIDVNGKMYSSRTTIPKLLKSIQSMYYEENVDKQDSSKILLYAGFSDPPGYGNYTRYFTSVNGGPFLPGMNSVEDDQVIDGKSYSRVIDQGIDRNSEIDYIEYPFFHKGDIITLKYCNIDREVFNFWRTMEYSFSSIGNPFSSPTKVIGNISDGALGYFGGYAVQYSKIIIPE